MKLYVLALSALALVGCTKTVEEMSYSERKALAQEIANRCYQQGVKSGSAEYEECSRVEVQREVSMRRRQASIEDARRSSPRMQAYCQNFGGNTVCF
jgi:hypothetical protein